MNIDEDKYIYKIKSGYSVELVKKINDKSVWIIPREKFERWEYKTSKRAKREAIKYRNEILRLREESKMFSVFWGRRL